jgi:hypothetical protein
MYRVIAMTAQMHKYMACTDLSAQTHSRAWKQYEKGNHENNNNNCAGDHAGRQQRSVADRSEAKAVVAEISCSMWRAACAEGGKIFERPNLFTFRQAETFQFCLCGQKSVLQLVTLWSVCNESAPLRFL